VGFSNFNINVTVGLRLLSLLEKSQWRNLTEISQVCELAPTEKTKSVCMNSPQTLHLIGTALDEVCHF
jgi:hypothetical protein